jgi:HK97 gp10 family phage protein
MTTRAQTAGKRGKMSVDLDADAFIAGLQDAVRGMVLRTERDLLRVGLKAQNNARQLCPVDTGRLRSSIIAEQGRDARGFFVQIGTNVEYAPYVEFGTGRSAAQPFLRPGVLAAMRSWGP